MKKTLYRLLSLMIVVAFVLSAFGCGGIKFGSSATVTEDSGDPAKSFTISAKYNIVTHSLYKRTAEISDAIMLVKSSLTAHGIESFITTDQGDGSGTPAEYEILIGYTSRPDSQRLSNGLSIDDYTYEIISENVIAICGGSAEATYEAAKRFCIDVLGYDESTKKASASKADLTVNEGKSYTYEAEYTHESFAINGIDIKDFSIAINDSQQMTLAQKILRKFGSYTGFSIPIVEYSKLKGNEKGVICIGAYTRDQEKFFDSLLPGGAVMLDVTTDSITIGIDTADNNFYTTLLDELFKKSTVLKKETEVVLTLPKKSIEIYNLDSVYGDIPEWTLTKETKTVVREGVTYIEQTYKDENNKPYRAYILKVDPSKASLYMGSTDDGYELAPEGRQTVAGHMKSAVANGLDVIAGTNGGFFHISSDYSPIGLTIKEGEVISNSEGDRAYVGFTKDGRMVIGASSIGVDTSELQTAIGGRNMIVHNSLPYELEKNDEFGTTSHPRTLAGVMADGTMVLAVIDGRQSNYSNGAPLAAAARFMISLGCVDAVNLDGGGSSTMVIRDGNSYNVKNSPSDGASRKVYNSLLVVAKES